tara:strand:+ start:744 stop:1055 length:312 start_codon:yes stop_codon:yes gene_type:complete
MLPPLSRTTDDHVSDALTAWTRKTAHQNAEDAWSRRNPLAGSNASINIRDIVLVSHTEACRIKPRDDCDWQMVFEASTEIISIDAAVTTVDGEPTARIIGEMF